MWFQNMIWFCDSKACFLDSIQLFPYYLYPNNETTFWGKFLNLLFEKEKLCLFWLLELTAFGEMIWNFIIISVFYDDLENMLFLLIFRLLLEDLLPANLELYLSVFLPSVQVNVEHEIWLCYVSEDVLCFELIVQNIEKSDLPGCWILNKTYV